MPKIGRASYAFAHEDAGNLFADVCQEFGDLADCIWKFNEQINNLWSIEADKIMTTDNPTMARARFVNETRKLDRTFPLLLNYSFVTTTYSVFERHLRRLCDLVRTQRKIPISSRHIAGGVVSRGFLYLEKFCGITRTKLTGYQAIDTMAMIRNCIVHTSGYIDDFGEASALEKRISKGEFLSDQHKHVSEYVRIQKFPDGRRLWFARDYAHLTAPYCRGFLIVLLVAAELATQTEHEA